MKTFIDRLRMTLALKRSATYTWRGAWRKTAFLVGDDDWLGI